MIGTTLSHYRILKKLGSGGMGDVYLAEDTRLERTVALKVLPPEFGTDGERMARFAQEAKAASALDHSSVAHIYELGRAEGVSFIAMQYVDGHTLSERLQGQPMGIGETISFAMQIADALDEAHSKNIVHRDIKPANVMITLRGQIKVLDFGLAKVMSETRKSTKTQPGVALGTIQYMSPEQAVGRTVDHRSDIFSLGAVMYQMAAGRVPFSGELPVETLGQILNAQPELPSHWNMNVPVELDRIIMKCLEKEPGRRYQSARDLVADLANLKLSRESGRVTQGHATVIGNRSWRVATTIALLIIAVAAAFIALRSSHSQTIHSLAVLPFVNSSEDTDTDYLSDGITDSTINKLSELPNLKVLARGTVFTYKGKEVDPRKVGRDLNVDAVVVGNIFLQGENLRVQVSLVQTKDGVQLWGEQYDRKLSDIFNVQQDISSEVSSQLRLKLTGEQKKHLNQQYTANVEAYRIYLIGRYHWNRRTRDDFQKAIESFQQAIVLDPHFALAYAGLADCYSLLSNWGFLPAREGYGKAKRAAIKALEMDPSLAEAHTSLASIQASYEWNWAGAEKEFTRAIQLNPNYSTAHHWFSFYLSQVGRHEEAIKEIDQALLLDPLSLIINANYGYTLYVARKYDEAIDRIKKTLELDPHFALAYQYLGYAYEQKGKYNEAIDALNHAVELAPDNVTFQADLARAYGASGQKEEATKQLNRLMELSKRTYVPPYDLANVYIGLGDQNVALRWLEKAYEEHSDLVTYIKMEPRVDPLRSDPRFKDLLSRLGLN